jgi:hypothetical protein
MNRTGNHDKGLQKRRSALVFQTLLSFLTLAIASCTGPVVPHKEPAPPTIQEMDNRLVLRIDHLLFARNYPGAKRLTEKIRNPSLKMSIKKKVALEWDKNDIRSAAEDLKKGMGIESLEKLNSLKKRDPAFFRDHPDMIPGDLAETYLDSLISSGKEFEALKEARSSFILQKDLEKTVETDAYIHLASRRMDKGKDHFALLDIQKGLSIDPSNTKLLKMRAILEKKKNYLTEEGFKQYGRQHLRRAIRYWSDALLLSPGNKSLRQNIIQAQKMLDRLKSLQNIGQVSKNAPKNK